MKSSEYHSHQQETPHHTRPHNRAQVLKMNRYHFSCYLLTLMLICISGTVSSSGLPSESTGVNSTPSEQENNSSESLTMVQGVRVNDTRPSNRPLENKLRNASDPLINLQQMYYPYAYQPYGYYSQMPYPNGYNTGYGYNQQQYPLAYPYSQPYLRGESYYADRMPRQQMGYNQRISDRRSNMRRIQRNRDSAMGTIDAMSDLLDLKLDMGSMLSGGRNIQRNSGNMRQRQRTFDYDY